MSLPPIQDPATEPKPKMLNIQPTFDKLNPRSLLRYNDKNGMTIVPALLINVISASHQTSGESPLNVFM